MHSPLTQGVLRTNEPTSLGAVEQELVRYDAQGRALAYEMRTLPPMFTKPSIFGPPPRT